MSETTTAESGTAESAPTAPSAEAPSPAAAAPTTEAAPVEAPPPAAAAPGEAPPAGPVAQPPVAVQPGEPTRKRRSVAVPVWLFALLAVIVLVVGAFFLGRETAPESADGGPATLAEAVEMTASGEMEVGDFDLRALLEALQANDELNLGLLGDLLQGQSGR